MVCKKGYKELSGGVCLRIIPDPRMDPHGYDPEFYLPDKGIKIKVMIEWDLEARTVSVKDVVVKSYTPKMDPIG